MNEPQERKEPKPGCKLVGDPPCAADRGDRCIYLFCEAYPKPAPAGSDVIDVWRLGRRMWKTTVKLYPPSDPNPFPRFRLFRWFR